MPSALRLASSDASKPPSIIWINATRLPYPHRRSHRIPLSTSDFVKPLLIIASWVHQRSEIKTTVVLYLLHNSSIEAFLTHPLPARVTAIDDKTRPNGALHAKAKVDLWSLVFDLWSFVSNSLVARADHDFGEETDDALYSSKDQKRSKTKDHPIDDRVSARVRVELRFRWPTEKTHESMKGVRAASNYTWKTSNRTDLGSPPLSIS